MRALFIGGTGTISSAVTALVAQKPEWELYLINRGNRPELVPDGVKVLKVDINDEAAVLAMLGDMQFDVVADFIGFVPSQVQRDIRLFKGRTKQYMYISSASVYQKPLSNYMVTEGTTLYNPYWEYSRDKIACEELLLQEYRTNGFPITIVGPSHTYGDGSIAIGVHGNKGPWQVLDRMRKGKPVIVHGDGSSLWTVTHNSDFAKGFVGLMGNVRALGEAVHIVSDELLTWDQIYRIAADALGVQAKLVHISTDFLIACRPELEGNMLGDKSRTVAYDNSKIKSLVPDFCATMRYDQGARRSIAYMLQHPETQVPDPEFDAWCDDVLAANAAGIQHFLMNHQAAQKM